MNITTGSIPILISAPLKETESEEESECDIISSCLSSKGSEGGKGVRVPSKPLLLISSLWSFTHFFIAFKDTLNVLSLLVTRELSLHFALHRKSSCCLFETTTAHYYFFLLRDTCSFCALSQPLSACRVPYDKSGTCANTELWRGRMPH